MRRRAIAILFVLGCLGLVLSRLPHPAPRGVPAKTPLPPASSPVTPEPAPSSASPVASEQPLELAWLFPERERVDWTLVETGSVPDRPPAPERGRELFGRLCTACHGEGGRGDGTLAAELPRPPRDLVLGSIRTRRARGRVTAGELFRTITAGAPEQGMPSFAHLSVEDRWAVVGRVAELRGRVAWGNVEPVELPRRPILFDEADGARTFARLCAPCHGTQGDGRGVLALGLLVDESGKPAPPAAFARGPAAFRAGASVEAIVRTVLLGRAGTRMVPLGLGDEELWNVASFVSTFAKKGEHARRDQWASFFRKRRALAVPEKGDVRPPVERWDAALSARFETAGKPGCLSCHEGVAPIASGRINTALVAVSGGDANRECTVCHEGRVDARERTAAHEGLVGNPGSLWVTSLGLGCGKCHSNHGALTSLMAMPFPEPLGGSVLAVVSSRTDPTGASGSNHAYRIQRALMAQETGKVLLETASAGLVVRDAPRFTDFAVDDPDGPVPCAGSDPYKAFIARALATGHVKRLERGEALPTFEGTLAMMKDPAVAGYVDYFRKDCARCHLWGEGTTAKGERRSSGCSACHVLNDDYGKDEGGDPTVPKDREGHPSRHEIVLAIPEEQCNHCHTRGALVRHTEPHDRAGLGCVDCHTSIDVHGDGNLYPSIKHQLEVRCEDCHGTPSQAPWDLPLGHGTKAQGDRPRGIAYRSDGPQYLLTDRGNVRANWLRENGRAVVVSLATGKKHVVPFLRDEPAISAAESVALVASGSTSRILAHRQAKHEKLDCSACHSSGAPRCMLCHLSYARSGEAQDYLLSALDYDARTTRQNNVFTAGEGYFPEKTMTWGSPEMRADDRGRLRPQVRGCDVNFRYTAEDGTVLELHPHMNPGEPDYPPPVAPTMAHEQSLTARPCAECHHDGIVELPGAEPR